MKQFWTVSLGAFVGSLVALFAFSALTFVFTFIAIIGLASSADSTTAPLIEDNSILYIDLDREIIERDNQSADDIYTLMSGKRKTYVLAELISAINQAKDDDRIKGIYIKGDGSMSGITSSYEVRQALVDFKENAGKWIYAYADSYSQNDYYLASVADSLFVNPEGIIDMHGLYSSIPYYKGLLDNVGVQMQVFKVGKFKSAVEPYILDDMSNENRLQINQFLTSIWNTIRFALIIVPLSIIIPLVLALLTSLKPPGYKFFRACIYLPGIFPLTATGLILFDLANRIKTSD